MHRIPASRVTAFWDRGTALEPSAPGELRMAQVVLRVDGRQVVAFLDALFPRYRLTEDGTMDPEHRQEAFQLAVAMIDWPTLGDDQVVNLAPRIAKREYQSEHS